jgi:hypothetical protein
VKDNLFKRFYTSGTKNQPNRHGNFKLFIFY